MFHGRPNIEAILQDMIDQNKATEVAVHSAGAPRSAVCQLSLSPSQHNTADDASLVHWKVTPRKPCTAHEKMPAQHCCTHVSRLSDDACTSPSTGPVLSAARGTLMQAAWSQPKHLTNNP